MTASKTQPIKVNTKKLRRGNGNQCFEEMNSFMACMAKNVSDIDDRCAVERKALTECAATAARKGKVTNTINFHLQRLSRLMRR